MYYIYEEKAVCSKSGLTGDFFVIDCSNSWLKVIALTSDNKLVMIKQYRHGSKRFEIEITRGLVELGEILERAGLRQPK